MSNLLLGKSKTPLQFKLFHTLLGFVVFFSLITVPSECQLIQIARLVISSELLWWPIVFFMLHLIQRIYGFAYFRHAVYLLIIFRVIYLFFIKLAVYLPGASFWTTQDIYAQVLNRSTWYFLSSSCLIWCCLLLPFKFYQGHDSKKVQTCHFGGLLIFITLDSWLLNQTHSDIVSNLLVASIIYCLLTLFSNLLTASILKIEQLTPTKSDFSLFKFKPPLIETNSSNFFKYHHILFCSSIVFFIASKTMAAKFISLGFFTINVGGIVFSLAYLVSDIMTDVYGIERTKQMIVFVIICNLLFVFDVWLMNFLAVEKTSPFKVVLHHQTKIFLVSALAIFLGMTINSSAISILKHKQRKKGISLKKEFITTVWTRVSTSSSLGIILDVSIFSLIAFYGIVPSNKLLSIIVFEDIYKIAYELLFAPCSVLIIYTLKVTEQVDIYDERTNMNPFKINTNYKLDANKFYENYMRSIGEK